MVDKKKTRRHRGLIRKPLRIVAWCFGFCLHWLGKVGYPIWTFFRKWATSRPFTPLAWGVPAVVAAVAVGLLAATGQRASRSDLVIRYRKAASEAVGRGDMKAAKLWFEKAALLNPDDPTYLYGQAIAAEQDGRHDWARQIMCKLAPDDKIGYGPAHFWIAGRLARWHHQDAQDDPQTDGGQIDYHRSRHHLTAGLKHDPDNLAALESLARLELDQENLPEAIVQYEHLVRKDRKFSLLLAQLHVMHGERERSRDVADAGADHFARQVKRDPDDVESRIYWARLHGYMTQYDRTVQILGEGVTRDPGPDGMNRLRMELGHAFLGWAKHVKRTESQQMARRLQLLQRALEYTPDSPHVLEELAMLAGNDSAEARAAYDALSTALAEGTATPVVHLLLGIAAYKQGDYDLEKQHLRLALDADPRLVVAANNLAWRLANSDPPQIDEALELIEQAVNQSPDRPAIRATRGRIYQLLGWTDDAILDLEFALGRLKDRPDIHTALADLYTTVGNDALASLHRERAARLKAKED